MLPVWAGLRRPLFYLLLRVDEDERDKLICADAAALPDCRSCSSTWSRRSAAKRKKGSSAHAGVCKVPGQLGWRQQPAWMLSALLGLLQQCVGLRITPVQFVFGDLGWTRWCTGQQEYAMRYASACCRGGLG